MSILGAVSVTTATVVKAVAVIGMAASAIALFGPALGFMLQEPDYTTTALGLIGMAASVTGWHFADWVDSKLHVSSNKAAQEAELARLQAHHGHAL